MLAIKEQEYREYIWRSLLSKRIDAIGRTMTQSQSEQGSLLNLCLLDYSKGSLPICVSILNAVIAYKAYIKRTYKKDA